MVQAAIDIADEEGLAALTMQAVSARLGFTTMAVYRYFPSKEALYDAIVDAGMGLPPAPQEPRGDWRAELTAWAHAKRAMLCSRPWLAELPFVAAPHGPNWLAWLEAVVDSLSATTLSEADKGQMLSILDGYSGDLMGGRMKQAILNGMIARRQRLATAGEAEREQELAGSS